MKKILGVLLVVFTAFFMTGCGSSDNDSSSEDISTAASDILIGKTFYYTDDYLDDLDGYYSDTFEKDKLTDKEYDKDENILYTDTVSVRYEGETMIIVEGNEESVCNVERMKESVTFVCTWNGETETMILWDTIDLAKSNPSKD